MTIALQADGEPAPGLLHQAHPASNEGVVMGLAAYPNDIMGKLERFVGTLRCVSLVLLELLLSSFEIHMRS
jgi:hypothetical protein